MSTTTRASLFLAKAIPFAKESLRRFTSSTGQSIALSPFRSEERHPLPPLPPGPITTIEDLPPEVLRDIFLASIPHEITEHRNLAVLRLCWVSSAWRDTAMQLSRLWSSLMIHIGPEWDKDFFWAMIDEWLERAGARPIVLRVRDTHKPSTSPCQACMRLKTDVLRKYSHKIYHLEGISPHMLRGIWDYRLEDLQCLTLQDADDRGNISVLSSFAPNLRRLAVDHYVHEFRSSPIDIISDQTYHQLTHLTACVAGYRTLLRILTACPNLEGAVFHCKQPGWTFPAPQFENPVATTLTLSSLSTLTIVLTSQHHIDLRIFRCLDLPLLTTLRLGSFHQSLFTFEFEDDDHNALKQISGIRRLSLFFDSYTSVDKFILGNFLLQLPDLEVLDIQDCLDLQKFFDGLNQCQINSQFSLLPHLQTLSLDIRKDREFDFMRDGAFGEFLASRSSTRSSSGESRGIYRAPFRVIFYVNKDVAHRYAPIVAKSRDINLPVELAVWDEDIGNIGSRWKYRLEEEEGQWVEGI
ncbi:hypothetical protein BDZ97DRAFT_1840893 [Flammula alnicola]|nr:hypothetical protein BDZ97DRAFT_1840893 [Flammula alnicola]